MAIQLWLAIEEDVDNNVKKIILKYIDKNMIKIFLASRRRFWLNLELYMTNLIKTNLKEPYI